MSRLADYFVIVGFDHAKARSGISLGKILQRFPGKDWEDAPFIDGIELFCQPQGWSLSTAHKQPTFFVSVLTDIDANRHYCACLSFNEPVAITPTKPPDEEGEEESSDTSSVRHHSIMYAPKCLVLISSLDYIATFKNCLGIIYSVYIENMPVQIETLIGNILGCIQVPPPGGPQVRFSVGAGDRQALQPPLSTTLPVSHSTVYQLFEDLGIHNVVTLFSATMTEHKILFESRSYTRLTEACHALTSLMYPFKYSHVYIPLLPAALVEVLSTPTPFIMGVHSSLKAEIVDLLDVIVVDLDGGSIAVPECISVPTLPEPLNSQLYTQLCMVMRPELLTADDAFPPQQQKASPPNILDKEIRAIFLRMFTQLLQGYRSCLTITRIHPKPIIAFHKAAFLGQRNFLDNDFVTKVLDCMFFNTFVSERGPPYRACDIFDELYAGVQDLLKSEAKNLDLVIGHIQDLAQELLQNENPNPQPYVQKIPKPTEGAFRRIHQPTFPLLDHKLVEDIMRDGLSKHTIRARLQAVRPQQPRIVPMGSLISSIHDGNPVITNSARRLEVIRNCVNCIFENKISDARKTFPAVLRALKNKTARLALTQELAQHVTGNKAMLEHQQFDLVVRLLNCALQDDSSMDEHGVAASVLPLCMAFCRKLCTGVIQFAFTCIQDHPVWANQQFWEAAFYQDVQQDIKALYLPQKNNAYSQKEKSFSHFGPYETKDFNSVWNRNVGRSVYDMISRKSTSFKPPEPSALEIAAEQMRLWTTITKEQQEEMVSNEESTVYSQAIHYANRMVSLRIPLDINKNTKSVDAELENNSNSNLTNSLPETDSLGVESGFEEDTSELGTNVIRFVSRFVDKVCTESGVTEEHIKSLHQMIPGVVAMQIETLETVHRESKRLPPIMKPKILAPSLLQGEELVMEGLRAYLIPDGREDGSGGIFGGPSLLPAEGAIFLTNYRIVFKGTPCDPFASEQVVVRCFPVATLTKEKRMHAQCLAQVDQFLQEGLQMRSSTFQLITVAFDEEVTSENIEMLRKLIHRVHAPPTIYHLFAFSSNLTMPQIPLHKDKEKNATLKVLAKKTLLRTAMKAGFKSKPSSRKHKYMIQGQPSIPTLLSPGRGTSTSFDSETEDRQISMFDKELSVLDEAESSLQIPYVDSKTLEKITERSYCRDYQRLGFGTVSSSTIRNKNELFRVTSLNSNYSVCRSYPALVAVPATVSDDSIRKFSRCYKHYRFPVITWCHPQKKALLLRGSSFLGKGVIGILKGPQGSSGTSSETSTHIEQEKFISTIVDCTPIVQGSRLGFNDSTLSITSLLLSSSGLDNFPTLTPELAKRANRLQKAVNTLRSSSGKSGRQSRWGSLKGRRQGSFTSLGSEMGYRTTHTSDFTDGLEGSIHTFHRVALYVLGEKAQIKGIKPESYPNCDFVPVDFTDVRQIKTSFKKLMRACIPSDPITDPDINFYRSIENSEWLNQLQTILQLSGVVVDLMDVQGSSVMICLEDGWDFTSQVSSVAQLCLDPYYRTFEGFRTLIEKEWLAFGHRFSHRGNHTTATLTSGYIPVFLQFLDVVHQIHLQFPLSFEFNQYFLKFMAYHYASCRFRTFLLDSECEREEAGWLTDDRGSKYRGLDSGSDDETGFSGKTGTLNSSTSTVLGLSLWEYIDKLWTKSSMFYNFFYIPFQEDEVLRPYCNISNLEIWDYYLKEELSHGPPYDLEAIAMEKQREEESEAADGISHETSRRIVNACYNNIQTVQPDVFSQLLEVIPTLETELGHLPQKWLVLWDKLELPTLDSHTRKASFTTQLIRSHGRSIHKRSTIEILVRGKMIGEVTQPEVYSHPHRFEKYNYTTPTYCDNCSHVLWGLVRTGMRCMDCGFNCHEKCTESVPKNCTKYKSVSDSGAASVSLSKGGSAENSSVGSSVTTVQTSSQYYNQFSSNVAENRTHEGYLFKRGALLKGWKKRWFVLDSIKHQLRYYNVLEEPHCKGFIDMEDVVSVTSAVSPQGVTKKCDEKAFFDLRTVRRIYNFMAADGPAAQEWIEKIQACLQ